MPEAVIVHDACRSTCCRCTDSAVSTPSFVTPVHRFSCLTCLTTDSPLYTLYRTEDFDKHTSIATTVYVTTQATAKFRLLQFRIFPAHPFLLWQFDALLDWAALDMNFTQHLLLDRSCSHAGKDAEEPPRLVELLCLLDTLCLQGGNQSGEHDHTNTNLSMPHLLCYSIAGLCQCGHHCRIVCF